jgi:hypothetical protein
LTSMRLALITEIDKSPMTCITASSTLSYSF